MQCIYSEKYAPSHILTITDIQAQFFSLFSLKQNIVSISSIVSTFSKNKVKSVSTGEGYLVPNVVSSQVADPS